jgi:hypothetical protein
MLLLVAFCAFATISSIPTKLSLAAGDKTPKQIKTKVAINPADYVGSDSCDQCHVNESAHFAISAHRKTVNDKYAVNERVAKPVTVERVNT